MRSPSLFLALAMTALAVAVAEPATNSSPSKCGGIAGLTCPSSYTCIDDPDSCDPKKGGADCSGTCYKFCGGIANLPCDYGFHCVDDPSDDCDPKKGGADCGGICKPRRHRL